MDLLVLRHGIAADRASWTGADADRPLTAAGMDKTRTVLAGLAKRYQPQAIWSSPWLRAAQSADIASEVWSQPVTTQHWLAGEAASPQTAVHHLQSADDQPLLLVGHEPDLGQLVGHLMNGPSLALRKAGLAVLRGEPIAGGMSLQALLHPALVLALLGET